MPPGNPTIHPDSDVEAITTATLQRLEEAVEVHRETQAQTRELLQQARAIKEEIHALLGMPRELIDEAKRQVSSLTDVSRKISGVVQQLTGVFETAQQHRISLDKANADAVENSETLRAQSERLGNLVGVIRRLHGSIDARIERLRGRLSQTDDMFRTVPRELENLRSLLNDDTEIQMESPVTRRPPGVKQSFPDTKQPADSPLRLSAPETPRQPRVIHRSTPATPIGLAPTTNVTLGDMVRKNQKLNEWLKQMVGEEALTRKIESLEGKRFDRRASAPTVPTKSTV